MRHLERFNFINGDLVSRKRVVSLNQDVDGFACRVLHNRYVLTTDHNKENIFDLRTGKFISSLPEKFRERDNAELPGLVLPDRKKSVSSAVSIRSYLALLYREPANGFIDGGSIDTIKVWNETKQDWLTLKVDGWNADIIDWIEE